MYQYQTTYSLPRYIDRWIDDLAEIYQCNRSEAVSRALSDYRRTLGDIARIDASVDRSERMRNSDREIRHTLTDIGRENLDLFRFVSQHGTRKLVHIRPMGDMLRTLSAIVDNSAMPLTQTSVVHLSVIKAKDAVSITAVA